MRTNSTLTMTDNELEIPFVEDNPGDVRLTEEAFKRDGKKRRPSGTSPAIALAQFEPR